MMRQWFCGAPGAQLGVAPCRSPWQVWPAELRVAVKERAAMELAKRSLVVSPGAQRIFCIFCSILSSAFKVTRRSWSIVIILWSYMVTQSYSILHIHWTWVHDSTCMYMYIQLQTRTLHCRMFLENLSGYGPQESVPSLIPVATLRVSTSWCRNEQLWLLKRIWDIWGPGNWNELDGFPQYLPRNGWTSVENFRWTCDVKCDVKWDVKCETIDYP